MSNLNGSAIREIERLSQQAETVLYPKGEGKGVYLLRQPDGSYERRQAPMDPRETTTVYDLESLGRELKRLSAFDVAQAGIYLGLNEVVAVLEDGERRQTVRLPLPLHPAFQRLSSFMQPTCLDQRSLVRLLRTELNKFVDATVISTFERLRMTSSSDETREARPMSAGLDSSIQKAVRAANGSDAPEKILFTLPVYDIADTRDEQHPVNVYIEFDHEQKVFVLVVVHNELREAQESSLIGIGVQLEKDERVSTEVIYGKPS